MFTDIPLNKISVRFPITCIAWRLRRKIARLDTIWKYCGPVVLWSVCAVSPSGSCVGTSGPPRVVLFGKAVDLWEVEPVWGRRQWGHTLRCHCHTHFLIAVCFLSAHFLWPVRFLLLWPDFLSTMDCSPPELWVKTGSVSCKFLLAGCWGVVAQQQKSDQGTPSKGIWPPYPLLQFQWLWFLLKLQC